MDYRPTSSGRSAQASTRHARQSAAFRGASSGPDAIVGTAEQIAEAFGAWREEGLDEVMCRLEPPSAGVVETIADAAQVFRASSGQ